MNNDRMSTVEAAICDSSRSDPTRQNQPSHVCVSGRPEFHHQALWRDLEQAGHAVHRFTEDLALLDAVGASSPSAIVYEIPAGGERAVQFLNQLAKLNHDACVILVGPEIGAESASAEESFLGREHIVPGDKVFRLAGETRLSAYDCEFVALASTLDVPLVTADKAVLKTFPDRALTMEAFAAR